MRPVRITLDGAIREDGESPASRRHPFAVSVQRPHHQPVHRDLFRSRCAAPEIQCKRIFHAGRKNHQDQRQYGLRQQHQALAKQCGHIVGSPDSAEKATEIPQRTLMQLLIRRRASILNKRDSITSICSLTCCGFDAHIR